MAIIGNKTIDGATELVGGLLKMYREELDKAWLKADGSLSVTIGLAFKPSETTINGIDVEAKIKFVTDQVKDSASRTIDEKQEELFKVVDIPIQVESEK